jgi:hypothetical protein
LWSRLCNYIKFLKSDKFIFFTCSSRVCIQNSSHDEIRLDVTGDTTGEYRRPKWSLKTDVLIYVYMKVIMVYFLHTDGTKDCLEVILI